MLQVSPKYTCYRTHLQIANIRAKVQSTIKTTGRGQVSVVHRGIPPFKRPSVSVQRITGRKVHTNVDIYINLFYLNAKHKIVLNSKSRDR
jgi:hypothetical protein